MSVMLVGCGTQKETGAVEDSTVSNVVAEAVTEVLTETTEAIEETAEVVEETTTEVIEEETTVVEETIEEETTEEVVEEPVPVEETPAPVEEAPAEEPAPAPASTGSTTWDVFAWPEFPNEVQQLASEMGLTVTLIPNGSDTWLVTINTSDETVAYTFYDTIATWGAACTRK